MGKNVMKTNIVRNRTDLAVELNDQLNEKSINGVLMSTSMDEVNQIKETIIEVTNEHGEEILGKPKGKYITLESDKLQVNDGGIHEPFVALLNKHLEDMIKDAKKIFVIGLGNRAVTPDALGPNVIDNLYVTRHLLSLGIVKKVREISAMSPGVMAQTGIETQTILKAIINEIKPDVILAVDALAAREPERLNTTIQLCDTGIEPGSGVGNNRARINEETLGVKVIALGVPTVISVTTIIEHALYKLFPEQEEISQEMMDEAIDENLVTMFVTPKDIDESIKRVSYTISEAINRLLL